MLELNFCNGGEYMNFKHGKFLAVGLLMLILAGCSKPQQTMTQDEFERNKQIQQSNKTEERK